MAVGTVLVTGGTGYIGSFTTLALLDHGYEVIIVDNLYNSSEVAVDRIELISGKRPVFHNADITDEKALDKIFAAHPAIDSVIHFAALKAVGESGIIPLEYYRVNVGGTIALLNSMKRHDVTNIVFSSSATVYGDAGRFKDMIPIPEHCPIGPTNTYGYTKASVEQIITDYITAQRQNAQKDEKPFEQFNGANLRYFNPCGAHPSGLMGEDPQGKPFNLLPILGKVATMENEELTILGEDYDSKDGTAIRDYIHVLDLASGHVAALNYLRDNKPGVKAWNLGSGRGSTVKTILGAFSEVVFRHAVEMDSNPFEKDSSAVEKYKRPLDKDGKKRPYLVEVGKDGKPIRLLPYTVKDDKEGKRLPYVVEGRRQGDVTDLTANPTLANEELGWKTQRTVEAACEDLWFWVKNNPKGYRREPKIGLLAELVELKKAELKEAELKEAEPEKIERKKAALEKAKAELEKAKVEREPAMVKNVELKKAELEEATAELEEVRSALEELKKAELSEE
ncbi:UDP-glucose-4-epimerase [Diatrype stigma]|uniref:UDP-glucose-4-epimerase n=1 Tax=Diatrype stigma TaxID=117547 RepID=A0AAN9YM69_9PEZI